MKNLCCAIAAFLLIPSASLLAQETYVLDALHTATSFQTAQFSAAMPRGSFSKTSGKVTLDRAAQRGSIEVVIDAASVVSGTPQRAEVLRSGEFFDTGHFPSITFTSNQLSFDSATLIGAAGELTLRGVTRPLALTITNFKCIPVHPLTRKPACGAEATATIKTSDFGMTPRGPDTDHIAISVVIEALLQ